MGTLRSQLAIITDEVSQDLPTALAFAREYGIRQVELRTVGGVNVADLSREQVEEIRNLLRDPQAAGGFRVVSIAGPFLKCGLPPGMGSGDASSGHGQAFGAAGDLTLDEHFDILRRCLDLAELLDAPLVRAFTFWREGPPTDEIFDNLATVLQRAGDMVAARGRTLAVENEFACFAATGVETAALLERVPSPAVGVIWDPGNAAVLGERAYPDGYRALVDRLGVGRIVHVHVKDLAAAPPGSEPHWEPPGRGVVDWVGQLRALQADGYEGAISLETHWRLPGRPEIEASRTALEELLRIVDAVESGTADATGWPGPREGGSIA